MKNQTLRLITFCRHGKKFLVRLLADEEGQALMEYILLISFAIVGATQIARGILKVLDQGVLRLGGQLEKDLKTGRSPLSAWRN